MKRIVFWDVVNGKSKSCGCHRVEVGRKLGRQNSTHGMTRSPEFRIWTGIRQRCRDPKHKDFANYGGRGIAVCDRWERSFAAFYADMGPRPSRLHTVDRIDPNGPYDLGNCRWATPVVQNRNKRSTRRVLFQGREMCLSEAAELAGLPYYRVFGRLKEGWSLERALSEPVRRR